MKYVIYSRISKANKDKDGNLIEDTCTFDTQINGCKRVIGDKEFVVFKENDKSGDLPWTDRPALIDAFDVLDKDDVLIVFKADRLCRNVYEMGTITHILNKKKASLVSVQEDCIGKDDAQSILFSTLLTAFAQYELAMIRTRTKHKLQTMKSKGMRVGHIPYGYKLKGDRHIEPDIAEQCVLSKMISYHDEGLSLRDICKRLTAEGHKTRVGTEWTFSFVGQLIRKRTEGELISLRASKSH